MKNISIFNCTFSRNIKNFLLSFLCLWAASCTQKPKNSVSLAPDTGQRLVANHAMVSSAQPLASKIGVQILKKGGNAVDAAVATAFALNIVEPEMSGLGGGGAMLIWLKKDKQAHFIDYYAAKKVKTYSSITGKEKSPNLLSVAIPGTVAGLLYAEEQYGNLSRKEVMQPAIDFAQKGFPMYLTLDQFIVKDSTKLDRYEGRHLYRPDGRAFPVGKRLRQTELSKSLKLVAEKGASAFYDGTITKDIVETLNKGGNPVTMADFQGYKIRTQKKPLVGTYKEWKILSAAPPQTGTEIIEDLNMLSAFNLQKIGLPTHSDSSFHVLTSALRAGMADWSEYNNDPNWGEVPTKILTSNEYARYRLNAVMQTPVINAVAAGDIGNFKGGRNNEGMNTHHETTHISVVDEEGNAVALTQTNSSVFGSGAWVDGFFLNNSGINISRVKPDTTFEATSEYRIRPSTISPTIVLNQDSSVAMVIGAPGGGRIPTAIVQNMVYMLDYNMDPMEALRMPRIFPAYRSPDIQLEKGFEGEVLEKSRKRGYRFKALSSGYARIYVIKRSNGAWVGAADPRHEGGVAGY